MSQAIIAVEDLSKRYLVGHSVELQGRSRYIALRDVIAQEARNFARNTMDVVRGRQVLQGDEIEEFWALKDVSFEVKQGDAVGIIGRNGAGKSTLLKILSRITEPTAGRVVLRGRVASLLEVGTGFHPELTGRENIFLNGAILGMTRREIKKKFDEIVAFAEIERFLDTPVKRFSSGMYVRLAFAVAAHLEPEILVVDEVLAVGDGEFQKKCLSKMDEASKEGRTILLVSHDLRRAAELCRRGILLNAGRVECDGSMRDVVDCYVSEPARLDAFVNLTNHDRSGSGEAQFQSVRLEQDGKLCDSFVFGGPFTQRILVKVHTRIGAAVIVSSIMTKDGISIHEFGNHLQEFKWITDVGLFMFTINIRNLMIYPGIYSIDLWLGDRNHHRVDYVKVAVTFEVVQPPTGTFGGPLDRANGLVFQSAELTCESVSSQVV
jgi:lipopolysaccharide transport system ATP-binding protein